jgi:hypothetical protein
VLRSQMRRRITIDLPLLVPAFGLSACTGR